MKIPKEAKLVFEGVNYDVYHWEQEMFDGSVETYEALKRADTAQVIATRRNKILIPLEEQPRREPYFSLFGGRVHKGEDPLYAAKRELLEESGLSSEDWELFKIYEPSSKIEWNHFVYIARDCKKVAEQKLDPWERIEIKELNFDEFVNILVSDDFSSKEIAMDLFRMKSIDGKLNEFKKRLI